MRRASNQFERTGRKGGPVSPVCQQKLKRLKQIIEERENWREHLEEVESMRKWVLEAESLLDGSWAEQHEPMVSGSLSAPNQEPVVNASLGVTNEQVGLRFDHWRAE